MKFDIKALIVLVLIIVISIWTINLLRPRNYSDTELTFAIGGGTVTITNPGDAAIAAEVRGTTSRAFTFSSSIEGAAGAAGRSTREGSGRTTVQLFTFELPSGRSDFSVENGTELVFNTSSTNTLTATVQPFSAGTTRNLIIALLVAIAGSLYYISSTMNHTWIGMLRGETPVVAPVVDNEIVAHGTPRKSFGDNISRK